MEPWNGRAASRARAHGARSGPVGGKRSRAGRTARAATRQRPGTASVQQGASHALLLRQLSPPLGSGTRTHTSACCLSTSRSSSSRLLLPPPSPALPGRSRCTCSGSPAACPNRRPGPGAALLLLLVTSLPPPSSASSSSANSGPPLTDARELLGGWCRGPAPPTHWESQPWLCTWWAWLPKPAAVADARAYAVTRKAASASPPRAGARPACMPADWAAAGEVGSWMTR